jgi:hypothetical protein
LRSSAVALVVVGGALLLPHLATADVVVVGKREIHGDIAEETTDTISIRVGDGLVLIPRKQVTAIRREEEVASLVGQARSLGKTHDPKALVLYDKAIAASRKKGDEPGAVALQKERIALASKLDKAPEVRVAKRTSTWKGQPSAEDMFLLEADLEQVRVYVKAFKEGDLKSARVGAAKLTELGNGHVAAKEARWAVGCFKLAREIDPEDAKRLWTAERAARLAACGMAVRLHDGIIAAGAIAPVVKESPKDAHVAYLEGRAEESLTHHDLASLAFKRALEGSNVPNEDSLPVDWLRELARQRAAGYDLKPGSAGYGLQWRRAESSHFVVYHELEDDFDEGSVQAYEDARSEAFVRLGFSESDVPNLGKVPLFMFKSQDNYIAGGGMQWAAAHVSSLRLEDGDARTIYAFPGRRADKNTIQHELAHVIVDEALPDLVLQKWAAEGVATYAEQDVSRAHRHMELGRALEAGLAPPLRQYLSRASVDESSTEAVSRFYAEAEVVFEMLVDKAGGVKPALEVAERIGRKGVDEGLREINTDVDALEAQLRADLLKKRE